MVAPAKQVRVERPAHSEILHLRVSLSDLRNHLEMLTARHHRGPLVFDRKVSVIRGSGAMLKGLMDNLVNLFKFNDSVLTIPALRKSVENLLMTTMLSLPHNKIDQLFENRSSMVAPAVVRRAEE